MRKALLILSLIPFFSSYLYAGETTIQETKGDKSPILNIGPGGTGSINYNIYIEQGISDVRAYTDKALQLIIDYQHKKLQELNRQLAELFRQEARASNEDAEKWVQDVLEKAPAFKKEMEKNEQLIKDYNQEFSKDLMAKVYKLFAHIIETIDSRFLVLKQSVSKVKYQKDERFILFNDETTTLTQYIIRTVVLPNGNQILIKCVTGNLRRGLVSTCPSLEFIEMVGQNVMQSFSIIPRGGGGGFLLLGGPEVRLKEKRVLPNVIYPLTGEEMLTESFKKNFDMTFQEFLQMALTR